MSKQTIDRKTCPFCSSRKTHDRGFDVTTCDDCGSQWRVTNAAKVQELREKLHQRLPAAHVNEGTA